MKKPSAMLMCLLAAAVVAWFMSSPGDSSTSLLQAKPEKKCKIMSGVLASVDAPTRSILIKNGNVNRKFEVDLEADILQNGAVCALAELQKGSAASVVYSTEGKIKVAHRVIVRTDPARPSGSTKQKEHPVSESAGVQ
jgi:hypothetical protein